MKHLNAFIVRYSCNDKWLDDKMYQLTLCQLQQLIDNKYDIFVVNNYNQINEHLTAKWLFIQSAGDYIVDRDNVWKLLHSIPNNVGLIGHILWNENDTDPYLHHQCMIINLEALKEKPLDFYSQETEGKKFIRSEKSYHGNYCPEWVKLSDEIVKRNPKFGTGLMSTILENGFDIINFDDNWRSTQTVDYLSHMPSRGYFNPEINTDLFSHCLKELIPDDRLDPAQKEAIIVIKNELKYNILNVLHWDNYPKGNLANLVISPANGFMGECIANTNGVEKIIFYDINPNNIDFKKKLYSEWNGKNYEKFYSEFATQRNLLIDPFSQSAKENAKIHMDEVNRVIKDWDRFKNMEVEFIHGDIIKIIDEISDRIIDKTILHTSTILKYYVWSNMIHDLSTIHKTREIILKKITETNSIWYET